MEKYLEGNGDDESGFGVDVSLSFCPDIRLHEETDVRSASSSLEGSERFELVSKHSFIFS